MTVLTQFPHWFYPYQQQQNSHPAVGITEWVQHTMALSGTKESSFCFWKPLKNPFLFHELHRWHHDFSKSSYEPTAVSKQIKGAPKPVSSS
jgi:hypothetical protein